MEQNKHLKRSKLVVKRTAVLLDKHICQVIMLRKSYRDVYSIFVMILVGRSCWREEPKADAERQEQKSETIRTSNVKPGSWNMAKTHGGR